MTKAKGNEVISHLFTSSAFVLMPFSWSPLHFNQNFRSSFFNSEGFRPHSEAPGKSFSSRSDVADTAMFVLLQPLWPRSDVIVTILSELSAIMNVVYIGDLLQPYTPTRQLQSSSKKFACNTEVEPQVYGDRSFQLLHPDFGTPSPMTLDQSRSFMFLSRISLKHYHLLTPLSAR